MMSLNGEDSKMDKKTKAVKHFLLDKKSEAL